VARRGPRIHDRDLHRDTQGSFRRPPHRRRWTSGALVPPAPRRPCRRARARRAARREPARRGRGGPSLRHAVPFRAPAHGPLPVLRPSPLRVLRDGPQLRREPPPLLRVRGALPRAQATSPRAMPRAAFEHERARGLPHGGPRARLVRRRATERRGVTKDPARRAPDCGGRIGAALRGVDGVPGPRSHDPPRNAGRRRLPAHAALGFQRQFSRGAVSRAGRPRCRDLPPPRGGLRRAPEPGPRGDRRNARVVRVLPHRLPRRSPACRTPPRPCADAPVDRGRAPGAFSAARTFGARPLRARLRGRASGRPRRRRHRGSREGPHGPSRGDEREPGARSVPSLAPGPFRRDPDRRARLRSRAASLLRHEPDLPSPRGAVRAVGFLHDEEPGYPLARGDPRRCRARQAGNASRRPASPPAPFRRSGAAEHLEVLVRKENVHEKRRGSRAPPPRSGTDRTVRGHTAIRRAVRRLRAA
jgi:hypothetical protein